MVKPFYVDTSGAWVPGHNQAQVAGSQLQAGARAELIPSDITRALSTFSGRIAAQTMQFMFRGNTQSLLNYIAFRPFAIMEAIKNVPGGLAKGSVVLNPAGGYSPVCYWMAKEYPDVKFIEMDTAKTIAFKKEALDPFGIPANLELREVDLQKQHLHEALDDKVDVIMISGAYVNHNDYRTMLKYIKNVLKDDGALIASFPYTKGIENFTENSMVFARIVTTPKGAIDSIDDFTGILRGTDFNISRVIRLSELAEKQKKPVPADVEVITVISQVVEDTEPDEITGAEDDILADVDTDKASSKDSVPPFIEFDPDKFKVFPKRYRKNSSDSQS